MAEPHSQEIPVVRRSRELDYRMFVGLGSSSGLATVLDQVGCWLRERGLDLNLSVDADHSDDLRRVNVRHHQRGSERAIRMGLEERNSAGLWTTTLLAAEDERDGWLSLHVANATGGLAKVPRLARYLIETLPLADGGWELSPGPIVAGPEQVEPLIELLTSADRRGPVFVAGTDDRLPFDAFSEKVAGWGSQVVGLGHVVIADPAGTQALEDRLGRDWTTPPWTIRTYLPGLDLDAPGGSRRHRMLGSERLGNDRDAYVTRMLGSFARAAVAGHSTPAPLAAWERRFERLDNRLIATAAQALTAEPELPELTPRQPATSEALSRPIDQSDFGPRSALDNSVHLEMLDSQLRHVQQVFGLVDLSERSLQRVRARLDALAVTRSALDHAVRRVDELQAKTEHLQADLDQAKDDLLSEQVERADEREEAEKTEDRALWLGAQLREATRHGAPWTAPPAESSVIRPSSFDELLARQAELGDLGVVITADEGEVRDLDAVDNLGMACRNAWEAMLALGDYLRARRDQVHSGSVHTYLQATPRGYFGFSPNKHKPTETEATMNQFGDERTLPVPLSIDTSGHRTMKAHFALAKIGMTSPRLYYLDDFDHSQKIYVGYIGRHMRNTQTN